MAGKITYEKIIKFHEKAAFMAEYQGAELTYRFHLDVIEFLKKMADTEGGKIATGKKSSKTKNKDKGCC